MAGIIAILIANIIWGAAPAIFKYSLNDIPPFTLAFIRFFSAGLMFLPFIARSHKILSGYEIKNIVLGGIWGISFNVAFFFMGLQLAPSINVHIIGSIGPILLYILSLIMLKEKAHPQIMKGMMVSLLGTLVFVFAPIIKSGALHSFTEGSDPLRVLLGNGFFVLSTLGAVLVAIYTKRASATVSPLLITCIQFFVGALTFAPLMMFELQSWSFEQLTQKSWIGIIYGTIFSSALAYFAHNIAISKMHAQALGIYSYIMPVIGVLVAIPLLGEYPDLFFILGSVFIFAGIIISERHPHYHAIKKKFHESKR